MRETHHWLIVESFENWNIDSNNSFSYYGMKPTREKSASLIQANDLLFVYVTGNGCFSDVRKATKSGSRRLRMGGDYLDAFPLCIDTAPVLTLTPEQWVPFSELRSQLSFTKDKVDWRQVFRTPQRLLSKDDASLIEEAIKRRLNEK